MIQHALDLGLRTQTLQYAAEGHLRHHFLRLQHPEEQSVHPVFLSDALKVMSSDDEVRFEFRDGKSPGKLTDRDDYVYVVMPIALE